ncbi:MAG: cell filamentation protein Fic [Desulfovibrio sp. S3730MH75]|nr:MAG: cell filamentation protein Fic [Desulfovibrio sp. S3730MH75]
MWIHEHQDWPNFSWTAERLISKLADVRHKQGVLLGKMENLGFELKNEAGLKILTNDIVHSSAIEGELLNPDEVRSSIAQRLGIEIAGLKPVGRDVDGIVEMMLDATQRYSEPLTKERLCDWHAALFPTGRSGMKRITVGDWRPAEVGDMQVISGPLGREKVHFEAPEAPRLDQEMTKFLEWFEREDDTDPVLRAGIAHLWFVTIHPFEDGNGRIARTLADMVLARAEGSPERFYSMSTQIELKRKDYYSHLERQQRGTPEITYWLEWFLECLQQALATAESTLSHALDKARLWETIYQQPPMNERQHYILSRMLDEEFKGYMNTSKYAKLAKCSTDTALRDIKDLKERGIFEQNASGGRSTSYRLSLSTSPTNRSKSETKSLS